MVAALTTASTFFPGLGLDSFGFEAEADNAGQLHFSQSRSTVERSVYRQL